MRVSLMTTEKDVKLGIGFAFREEEEKSVFTEEPGAAYRVDILKGEGLES